MCEKNQTSNVALPLVAETQNSAKWNLLSVQLMENTTHVVKRETHIQRIENVLELSQGHFTTSIGIKHLKQVFCLVSERDLIFGGKELVPCDKLFLVDFTIA